MNDVRVLVTGAGGFIGSHLVERLVAHGARVTALVHYNSRGDHGLLALVAPEVLAGVRVVQGDIRDPGRVAHVVEGQDVVFHLAALIGIPYSYVTPEAYVATNVVGTMNVLEAARRVGVRRLVHTSTSEVYGTARYTPIDEAHPLQAQSPYSATKIGADKLVESYVLAFGLPAVILRPFNAFGPRQSARAIVPTIISQALVRDRIELGALDPVRDLTFVHDTAEAFVRMAGADLPPGEVVNAGTGLGVSIGELAERVLAAIGRRVPVVQVSERLRPGASEVLTLIADASRARAKIGWEPRTTLDEGIARTVAFIRRHLDAYRTDVYTV